MTMRLITRSELTGRSNYELAVLFKEASDALARSDASSAQRRAALATLENIAAERAARLARPRGP